VRVGLFPHRGAAETALAHLTYGPEPGTEEYFRLQAAVTPVKSPQPNQYTYAKKAPQPNQYTYAAKAPQPNQYTYAAKAPQPNQYTYAAKAPQPNQYTYTAKAPQPNQYTYTAKAPQPNQYTYTAKAPQPNQYTYTAKAPQPNQYTYAAKAPQPNQYTYTAKAPQPNQYTYAKKAPASPTGMKEDYYSDEDTPWAPSPTARQGGKPRQRFSPYADQVRYTEPAGQVCIPGAPGRLNHIPLLCSPASLRPWPIESHRSARLP
jgi:hypothetical protein